MRNSVQQLDREWDRLVRLLNIIYDFIQNSSTLIERVRWKIHWNGVRDTYVQHLIEQVAVLRASNECDILRDELLDVTLTRVSEGFVRETSHSERGDSSFSRGICSPSSRDLSSPSHRMGSPSSHARSSPSRMGSPCSRHYWKSVK